MFERPPTLKSFGFPLGTPHPPPRSEKTNTRLAVQEGGPETGGVRELGAERGAGGRVQAPARVGRLDVSGVIWA